MLFLVNFRKWDRRFIFGETKNILQVSKWMGWVCLIFDSVILWTIYHLEGPKGFAASILSSNQLGLGVVNTISLKSRSHIYWQCAETVRWFQNYHFELFPHFLAWKFLYMPFLFINSNLFLRSYFGKFTYRVIINNFVVWLHIWFFLQPVVISCN